MKVKVVDNSKPYIYEEEQQASIYTFCNHSSYILFKVDVKQAALSTEDRFLYKPEGAYRIQ
jgi:hypothetical protein